MAFAESDVIVLKIETVSHTYKESPSVRMTHSPSRLHSFHISRVFHIGARASQHQHATKWFQESPAVTCHEFLSARCSVKGERDPGGKHNKKETHPRRRPDSACTVVMEFYEDGGDDGASRGEAFTHPSSSTTTLTAASTASSVAKEDLRKRLTLDLNGARGLQLSSAKKSRYEAVLESPDLNMLKLPSPELERLIMQQNGLLCTSTPTPSQFLYPKAPPLLVSAAAPTAAAADTASTAPAAGNNSSAGIFFFSFLVVFFYFQSLSSSARSTTAPWMLRWRYYARALNLRRPASLGGIVLAPL